ncbi:hypothetical protein H5410_049315 [Solanum commersonii]|uniref:Uncharacterized protein n=1 Tax=Solanum commersonii TaxID=4109 RepID=A0A9J5WUM3_SOLCO|nr:hypothetical protein H5410_049315 [Solanum commersonii]
MLLSMAFYGDSEFRCHFCLKRTWTSVKNLVMEPVGYHGQNGLFTMIKRTQRSYGANLSPQPKRHIYKVNRAPEQSTAFYGDPKFRRLFTKNLHRPPLKH